MNGFRHVRVSRDDRGVMTAALDVAGRSVNAFDTSVVDELSHVVDDVAADAAARMLILRSTKEKGFAAGADLAQVRALATSEEATQFMEQGRRLGAQLESLTIPTIAVLHGACLGGGLELALFCRLRIARDDQSTKLGLPETKLGLIPGWGGTWLLPHLVGPVRGLRMILDAQSIDAQQAARIGLVQYIAPPEEFDAMVQRVITERIAAGEPRPAHQTSATFLQRLAVRWHAAREQRRRQSDGANPAIGAALRAVRAGVLYGRDAGLQAERDEFCRILFDPRSRVLLEQFFEQRRH